MKTKLFLFVTFFLWSFSFSNAEEEASFKTTETQLSQEFSIKDNLIKRNGTTLHNFMITFKKGALDLMSLQAGGYSDRTIEIHSPSLVLAPEEKATVTLEFRRQNSSGNYADDLLGSPCYDAASFDSNKASSSSYFYDQGLLLFKEGVFPFVFNTSYGSPSTFYHLHINLTISKAPLSEAQRIGSL